MANKLVIRFMVSKLVFYQTIAASQLRTTNLHLHFIHLHKSGKVATLRLLSNICGGNYNPSTIEVFSEYTLYSKIGDYYTCFEIS